MTVTTRHEAQIVADPDVPLVRITREFDAPVEKVFRAHVDPELVARWMGPKSIEVRIDTWEGMPDGVALEKVALAHLGDGRTRLTATSLVDSFEGRDAFVASGMDVGVQEGYEKLDELLAR